MILGSGIYGILELVFLYFIGEKLEETIWFLNIDRPFIFTIFFSFIFSMFIGTKELFLKNGSSLFS